MNKRGISVVVASVLIILIVVAAVGLVWGGVLPVLKKSSVFSECDVELEVVTSGGYTVYDVDKSVIQVQVRRGNDDYDIGEIMVILDFDGDSYDDNFEAPEPGQFKTYSLNVTGINQGKSLDSVKVVPVYNGKCDDETMPVSTKIGEGKIVDLSSVGGGGVLYFGDYCIVGETTTNGCSQLGICSGSMRTCNGGLWSSCDIVAQNESCSDGLDNDCDGFVDNNDSDCIININTVWSKTFGMDNSSDTAYSVQQTSDGGYILAGRMAYPLMGSDFFLVKTDSSGKEEWNNTFDFGEVDTAYSVQQTSEGGYILAGSTIFGGFMTPTKGSLLVKVYSNGTEQWRKVFSGKDQTLYSVQQTSDGGYIAAGDTYWDYDMLPYDSDAWLVKTDSSGNEDWSRSFGGPGLDVAYSVQQTFDSHGDFDGYILAGSKISHGMYLVKINSDGDEEWSKEDLGEEDDVARSVQQTFDSHGDFDGYILAGSTELNGDDNFRLVKTDLSGNEDWNKVFDKSISDTAYSVQQTSDGGYILAGSTESNYDSDAWLIKTDSNGNEQWNKDFNISSFDVAYSVLEISNDEYVFAGGASLYDSPISRDFWLVKVEIN